MPFSANFVRARLTRDGDGGDVLEVAGKSYTDPNLVTGIEVAVVPLDGGGGDPGLPILLTAPVQNVAGAMDWTAMIPLRRPLPAVGTTALIVGAVALSRGNRFVWAATLTIEQDANPPPPGSSSSQPATRGQDDPLQQLGEGFSRHGSAPPADQAATGDTRYFKMFNGLELGDPGDGPLAELAQALIARAGESAENTKLPAGYTYLGQFVDHDVTFDATSRLDRDNDPGALVNFRTPRLDLDSLYGSGPMDEPFQYDWATPPAGVRLLVGPGGGAVPRDLPRNQDGRALIGDARNDENLITSQLHLLFIRFHNKVVDRVIAEHPGYTAIQVFAEAQRLVRWHYQWIVMDDLLPRIVGRTMADLVFHPLDSTPVTRAFFLPNGGKTRMPVEFAGAVYRFGHSMVREDYRINGAGNVPVLTRRAGDDRRLAGFRSLPAELEIDWEHFFELPDATPPQPSMLIDTSLAEALNDLPDDGAKLVQLNLMRGKRLGLPAGAEVAKRMGVRALTRDELVGPLTGVSDAARDAIARRTPLWYYVLCEAHTLSDGEHLGPVGGRIVAEVLAGVLQDDPTSHLHADGGRWRPTLGAVPGRFKMPDLVTFAG